MAQSCLRKHFPLFYIAYTHMRSRDARAGGAHFARGTRAAIKPYAECLCSRRGTRLSPLGFLGASTALCALSSKDKCAPPRESAKVNND